MVNQCQELLNEYCQKSKGVQAFQRVKRKLLTFANLVEIEIENWTTTEIFAAWRYLEQTSKQKLTHRGLRNKFQDIKQVFVSMKLDHFTVHEKELNLIQKGYINSRIDGEDKPWTKKNANRPPYTVWKMVAEGLKTAIDQDVITNPTKRLRLRQSLLALVWSRSCGARLRELIRVKYSDITVMTMGKDQLPYLNINIRRSKSNQQAKKQLSYKMVENKVDPILCPFQALKDYLNEYDQINQDGHYIFIAGIEHLRYTFDPRALVDNWNKTSSYLRLPSHHYPQAHSGHDCFIILAMAQKRPKEEILDATQWQSLEVLPHYVQGPAINGINHSLATTSVEALDELMQDLVEYNIKIQG